jgi:hypothetical protein
MVAPMLASGEVTMWALKVLAIYVMPFLLLGAVIKFLMKRQGLDRVGGTF